MRAVHTEEGLCQGPLSPAGQGRHIVPTRTHPSTTLGSVKESSVPVHSLGSGRALGTGSNLGVFRLLTQLICLTKMPKLVQLLRRNSSESKKSSASQRGEITGSLFQHVYRRFQNLCFVPCHKYKTSDVAARNDPNPSVCSVFGEQRGPLLMRKNGPNSLKCEPGAGAFTAISQTPSCFSRTE